MDKIKLKNHEFELAGGHRTMEDVFEFDLVKKETMTLSDVHNVFDTKEETASITITIMMRNLRLLTGIRNWYFLRYFRKIMTNQLTSLQSD